MEPPTLNGDSRQRQSAIGRKPEHDAKDDIVKHAACLNKCESLPAIYAAARQFKVNGHAAVLGWTGIRAGSPDASTRG
jgi:hypothetical protein